MVLTAAWLLTRCRCAASHGAEIRFAAGAGGAADVLPSYDGDSSMAAAQVPAVLLVCRNSTDTAYFQRLRPYPRVALRRSHTRFKDYDKTPIGFGVVVFCIAKAACRRACAPCYLLLPNRIGCSRPCRRLLHRQGGLPARMRIKSRC